MKQDGKLAHGGLGHGVGVHGGLDVGVLCRIHWFSEQTAKTRFYVVLQFYVFD